MCICVCTRMHRQILYASLEKQLDKQLENGQTACARAILALLVGIAGLAFDTLHARVCVYTHVTQVQLNKVSHVTCTCMCIHTCNTGAAKQGQPPRFHGATPLPQPKAGSAGTDQ